MPHRYPIPTAPYCPQRCETHQRMDIYLAPGAANASDLNDGDLATPLATLAGVLGRLQRLGRILAPVVVHMESGTHAWPADTGLYNIDLQAPLVFLGDGAGQAGDDGSTELFSGTLGAGTTSILLDITGLGGSFGDRTLIGKTVEILDGAAVGYLRTIGTNLTDDVTLVNEFPSGAQAPASGDAVRIREPAVIVTLPPSALADDTPTAVPGGAFITGVGSAKGNPLSAYDTNSSDVSTYETNNVYFVNMQFASAAQGEHSRLQIASSSVCFHGCEFTGVAVAGVRLSSDKDSLVQLGMDFVSREPRAAMALELGLAASSFSWAGWTLAHLDSGTRGLRTVSRGIGFIVSNSRMRMAAAEWAVYGGYLDVQDDVGLRVENGSHVRLVPQVFGLLRIRTTGSIGAGASLDVQGGSAVHLSKTILEKADGAHVLRVAATDVESLLPSTVSLVDNCELISDAVAAAQFFIGVSGGGVVNISGGALTLTGTPITAELAVQPDPTSSPAVGAGGTYAALATSGDYYPTSAALTAELHGMIRRL